MIIDTFEREITDNENYSNKIIEILKDIYSKNSWDVDYETNMKYLYMSISKDEDLYYVDLYNEWKSTPTIKKYDIIAVRWEGNATYIGGAEGIQTAKKSDGTEEIALYNLETGFDNFKYANNGVGLTQNLFDDGTKHANALYLMFKNGSKCKFIGSYQHASNSTITFEQSKSYSFSSSGLGGVLYFSDSSIRNKYDGMKGVYYILP